MSDVDPQPGTASPWFKTLRGKVVLGAGGVVVVAAVVVVIVVTQVVVPNRQAAQAAAASASAASASAASASAASVKAEGDLAAAHLAFGTASKACADANKQLSDAITSAQATAGTDPSTMQDPTLIDRLNQAITAAQAVVPCTPPTMATDTDAITQQTTQMGTDTQAVTSEVQNLGADSQSVQASVQTKKTATSQVAASAAAKAQTGSTTWTSDDGYVYGISWSGVGLKATIDPTQGAPGQLVVSYSVFGTVTVTNQTRGKQAPMVWVALNSIYPKSASDLFCDTDCQSWLEFSGNLGGQQVSSFGRLSYALHTYPDPQSLNSPPILGVGAADSNEVYAESGASQRVTYTTNMTADQLIAQVENVAGWGVSIIKPGGGDAMSTNPSANWLSSGTYCLSRGQGDSVCFLGVSTSLAG